MKRIRVSAAQNPPRRIPELWRKTGLALATLAVCAVGARIVAPGLNGQALHDFLRAGGSTGLLRVYDWFVGGASSRGAVLALGIMPYVSARIMVRLLTWRNQVGQAKRTRWTRWLTGGLALVQSYGFARFVEGIPGAVAHPGVGFLAKTMAVLTTGAIGVMLLSERLTERHDDDLPVDESTASPASEPESLGLAEPIAEGALPAGSGERRLSAGETPDAELYRPRGDRAGVPRQADDAKRRDG